MIKAEPKAIEEFDRRLQTPQRAAPRLSLREGDVKNGLGKLVLTLVEFLRELLERQAIARIEAGSLSDEQIERLGRTFMELADQIEDLKRQMGLEDEELNLDLGPLGKLI